MKYLFALLVCLAFVGCKGSVQHDGTFQHNHKHEVEIEIGKKSCKCGCAKCKCRGN